MDKLNKTDDPKTIFEMVLRSLESYREKKAEQDLLDNIAGHYSLEGKPERWPKQLVDGSVAVDDFLKYTLGLIGPFVEMILDIYAFLREYVSTTGGRTEHFRIDSDDLHNPWSFDVSKLPREIQWISTWINMTIEEVSIDWHSISQCLGNDGGIFYACVRDVRLIQSLIAARREGSLSTRARAAGDRIHQVLLRSARAWYRSAVVQLRAAGVSTTGLILVSGHIPSGNAPYRDGSSFGIDLDVALGDAGYSEAAVFRNPKSGTDAMTLLPESEDRWATRSVWGPARCTHGTSPSGPAC